MAEILEEPTENEEAAPAEEEQPQEIEQPEPPEKYRDKTPEELMQMHQESEKTIGRQGSELGELRKLVDTFIQQQASPAPEQPEEIDWFADPDKATNRAIDEHPAVKEAQLATVQFKKGAAQAQLMTKHPDYQQIAQDNSFAEWIKSSPVRIRLYAQADQQYDFEAADELFTLWKERQGLVTQTAQVEEKARRQAVKAASTGNAKASGEPSSKKIYRRADLIKLMKEDPDRYEQMQPEIMQAYADKRVK